MNVTVKHNGTNITGYVISYERVHKICTGIGTLNVEIADSIPRTFKPWDSIDIYENGDFKVRYYVSSVQRIIPKSVIALDCQDNSKRIVDYFIPDSYTVDYPSYTRYWIEKFLDEAGVSYEFETTSSGNLLSNFTQLGLVTVYEQVLTLLQMSGWYMYFDGNGKAIIGSLNVDLADVASVGKTDILDILVTKDDKMLRNKALVFGGYDAYSNSNAKASVTVHTPWNYDNADVRTVVISNSSIPDNGSAYGMANQIIKEFARITIEKHITIWGARDFNLGTALRVTSNIWKGKGLVTTFGVSMSNRGLVTNVVLDERCPRLFGFFDFGDYVYVSFYGDGVWRKHIKFDPTWYNFSDGLTDLSITDLHINQGLFGSVGHSGQMYYAVDSTPWHEIPVPSYLTSSQDNQIDPSASGTMVPFSGLMARATVVDRTTNYLKFGIDNASGVNLGDYFMEHGGATVSGVTGSGVAFSGSGSNFDGKRAWVIEYDVLGGDTLGTSYPVSLSGNYAYTMLDIDNDGTHDFVSVATSGQLTVQSVGGLYNFGQHTNSNTTFGYNVHDSRSITSYNSGDQMDEEGRSKTQSLDTATGYVAVFENQTVGERETLWVGTTSGVRRIKRIKVTKVYNPTLGREEITFTSDQSPSFAVTIGTLGIYKDSSTVYRIFHSTSTSDSTNNYFNIFYKTWDVGAGTLSADSTAAILTVPKDTVKGTFRTSYTAASIQLKDTIYVYATYMGQANAGNTTDVSNYVKIYSLWVSMASGTASINGLLHTINYTPADGTLAGHDWIVGQAGPGNLLEYNDSPFYMQSFHEWNENIASTATVLRNYLVTSKDGINFQNTLIQQTTTSTDTGFILVGTGSATQTTHKDVVWYWRSTNGTTYVFTGDSITILNTVTDVPDHWKPANIFPLFGGSGNYYITKSGSTYYFINSHTLSIDSTMTFDARYTSIQPVLTVATYGSTYFWTAQDTILGKKVILKSGITGVTGVINPFSVPSFGGTKTWISGNFWINQTVSGTTSILYLDNVNPGIVSTIYQILRRDNTEFKLIEQEAYPIRLDISNNSPVVTVGSGSATFNSNLVYDTELVVIKAVPSGVLVLDDGDQVNDYRYTYLQPNLGAISSGTAISSTILFVTTSGAVMGADALTYSGGFTEMFSIPSGLAGTRIETSNFGQGGQYIFVTTSGDLGSGVMQGFAQQDPQLYAFNQFNAGFPQSRATMIRLDDIL